MGKKGRKPKRKARKRCEKKASGSKPKLTVQRVVAVSLNTEDSSCLNARWKRLDRFPWLPFFEESDDEEEQKNLPELPAALWDKIASCLCDNDRFRLRVLNSTFYGAYYNARVEPPQHPPSWDVSWDTYSLTSTNRPNETNAFRMLRLCGTGRNFPRVAHLGGLMYGVPLAAGDQSHAFTRKRGQNLSRFHWCFPGDSCTCVGSFLDGFPKLTSIGVECAWMALVFKSPMITRVEIKNANGSRAFAMIFEQFPNLQTLALISREFGLDEPAIGFQPHHRLRVLHCSFSLKMEELRGLQKNFPSLDRVAMELTKPLFTSDEQWKTQRREIVREVGRLMRRGVKFDGWKLRNNVMK